MELPRIERGLACQNTLKGADSLDQYFNDPIEDMCILLAAAVV